MRNEKEKFFLGSALESSEIREGFSRKKDKNKIQSKESFRKIIFQIKRRKEGKKLKLKEDHDAKHAVGVKSSLNQRILFSAVFFFTFIQFNTIFSKYLFFSLR